MGFQTSSNLNLRLSKVLDMPIYAIPNFSGEINAFNLIRLRAFNLIRVEKILRYLFTNPEHHDT